LSQPKSTQNDVTNPESRLASLLLSYIPAVCAFVAPHHPGASTAIFDRLSHSRALTSAGVRAGLTGLSCAAWQSMLRSR